MMRFPVAVAMAVFPVLMSCNRLPVVDYSDFVDIPPSGIPQNWEYDFNVTASDSADIISGRHDAVLVVRYTGKCPSRSIILNLEELSLSHQRPDTTVLELQLFDKEGLPLGKGAYGIYEIADTLHKGIVIPNGYTLSFSSPLPDGKTAGIKSIGLVIKQDRSGY